jgi:hypothetical protein
MLVPHGKYMNERQLGFVSVPVNSEECAGASCGWWFPEMLNSHVNSDRNV